MTRGTGPLQGARPSLEQTRYKYHPPRCVPTRCRTTRYRTTYARLHVSPVSSSSSTISPLVFPFISSAVLCIVSAARATPTQPSSKVGWPVVQEFGRGSMSGVGRSCSCPSVRDIVVQYSADESAQLTTNCLVPSSQLTLPP